MLFYQLDHKHKKHSKKSIKGFISNFYRKLTTFWTLRKNFEPKVDSLYPKHRKTAKKLAERKLLMQLNEASYAKHFFIFLLKHFSGQILILLFFKLSFYISIHFFCKYFLKLNLKLNKTSIFLRNQSPIVAVHLSGRRSLFLWQQFSLISPATLHHLPNFCDWYFEVSNYPPEYFLCRRIFFSSLNKS